MEESVVVSGGRLEVEAAAVGGWDGDRCCWDWDRVWFWGTLVVEFWSCWVRLEKLEFVLERDRL